MRVRRWAASLTADALRQGIRLRSAELPFTLGGRQYAAGTVLAWPAYVDTGVFPAVRTAPEETGCHVVPLGDDRVLLAASAPRTVDLVANLGFTPVVVDIGEFEKLEVGSVVNIDRLERSEKSAFCARGIRRAGEAAEET